MKAARSGHPAESLLEEHESSRLDAPALDRPAVIATLDV